jgi:hypothetical protein
MQDKEVLEKITDFINQRIDCFEKHLVSLRERPEEFAQIVHRQSEAINILNYIKSLINEPQEKL